jgi:phosphomevalonate kinase
MPARPASPWVDATALRSRDGTDRKLGLGSSAAMLVAALAALELAETPNLGDESLQARIFEPALRAHRSAQRGGSGIDVVASTFGGVRRCVLANGGAVDHRGVKLPAAMAIEIWSSNDAASTPDMLDRFWALKNDRPAVFRKVVGDLSLASEAAARASDAVSFVDACRAQLESLTSLGALAGSPIVTPDAECWDQFAHREGAVVLPSGAGGGDIVLWIGTEGPDAEGILAASRAGLTRLPIGVGARGAHCASFGQRP